MLSVHDDPGTAVDFALSDIAEQIEMLDLAAPEDRSHYRDRMADLSADLMRIASETPREHTTCESQARPNNGGPGGKAPLQAKAHPSTKWTPTPGSTPSASSDTASGHKAQCSLPASGGSPVKSTLKPANSLRPKSAARKSTASSSTRGEHGRG